MPKHNVGKHWHSTVLRRIQCGTSPGTVHPSLEDAHWRRTEAKHSRRTQSGSSSGTVHSSFEDAHRSGTLAQRSRRTQCRTSSGTVCPSVEDTHWRETQSQHSRIPYKTSSGYPCPALLHAHVSGTLIKQAQQENTMLDILESFTPISDRCAHQRNVYHLQTLQL